MQQPTTKLLEPYLKLMAKKEASDIYLITDARPSMKVHGKTTAVAKNRLVAGHVQKLAYSLLNEEQRRDFEINREYNLGFTLEGIGRFRVNIYIQRSEVSMVIRYIKWNIPSIDELKLPSTLKDLVLNKNGLILVVGSTGSGKSTSLAAMINHRNLTTDGHILTIEDPVEFIFKHEKSIISQREVGIDTLSYANALKEALREAPEVIMIGESRDQETMEAAISFADTGHLALTTLHAVNSNQAMDRILNMFPTDKRSQLLMDLSLNLKAIISQRLIPGMKGEYVAAIEIMMNTPYISNLIREGDFGEIKEVMKKGGAAGMRTFDQSLYDLYKSDKITIKNALAYADSSTDLEWRINFGGESAQSNPTDSELTLPSEET